MKIGIMTLYYDNQNIGGLLQAYALQKCISSMGYNAELISYNMQSGFSNKYSHMKYKYKKKLRELYPGFRFFNSRFGKSVKKFELSIPHSRYVESNGLSLLNEEYDAFICGSDQIWNPIGWQPNFFLTFSKKPKISYAPSISRDFLTRDELLFIDRYTKDFIGLSVREKNAAELLTEKLGRKFKLVPDPTLLLTKEEWEQKFSTDAIVRKPYVFAYFLGFDEQQRIECISFAKKRGLDIYFVPYMNKESFKWERKNKNICTNNYSVENFISLIKCAELVLTDSFHGTVLSCIFETPFYVLNRKLAGNEKSMNSRIETLFFELSIPCSRMIKSLNEIGEYDFLVEEKKTINDSKDVWRNIGINYLTENLVKIKHE